MNSLRFWSRRAWFLHGYLIATLFLPPFPMVRAYWTDSNSDGVKEEVANPTEGDSWWSTDRDGDRLTNEQEVLFGSDPYNLDSDRDGLTDYVEFLKSQAAMDAAAPLPYDPWQWDTNANGFSDYDEYYQQFCGYQPVVNYTSLPGGASWPAGTFKTYSDADGDGTPNPDDGDPLNMDRDGDGILNWNEAGGQMDDATNGYVEPPPATDPGVNIGGYWYPTGTPDSDNDGTPDHLDAFPYGSFWYNNTEYAGASNDRDGDGIPDPADIFPDGSFSYLGTEYGGIWVDQDGDGVPDVADAWPTIAGSYWYNNSEYPGILSDQDGDGIPDTADATPNGSYMWGGTEYLGPWVDQDGDGTPDAFDTWPDIAGSYTYNGATYSGSMPDQDGDQVPDWADPFPTINGSYTYGGTLYPGPWVDQDNDGQPDAHDPFPSVAGSYTYEGTLYPGPWVDQDNDGLPDAHDPFPSVAGSYWYNATQYGGAWVDSDNDGTPDAFDPFPNGSYWYNGTEYAGTWADSDSDGTPNSFDPFPNGSYWYNSTEYAGSWVDSDSDSIPDPQDPFPSAAGSFWYNGTEYGGAWNDADMDNIPDSADATPNGGYWYGSVEYAGTWSDQDGDSIPDPADATPNGGYWYNGIEYAGTLSDQDYDGIPDPQDSYPDSRWNGAPYYPYNGSEYAGTWADYDNDGVPDPADNWPADSENGADNDNDGLSNYDERTQYGTNPNLQDTDGDQLDDKGELFTWHTNPLLAKTDPRQPYTDYHMVDQTDTDTDGIPDRIEQFYSMDINDPNDALGDLDGDGHTNLQAYQEGWNLAAGLYRYDADADGILDVLEDAWSAKYPGILSKTFFNDSVQDYDGDGVLNFEEVSVGLDPGNSHSIINAITDLQEWTWLKTLPSTDSSSAWQAMEDADHNGAPDGLQAFVADGTVPLLQRVSANDCDGDGMPDLWEHRFGVWKYPSVGLDLRNVRDVVLDPDQDGLNNLTEFRFGSDPLVRETNRDGVKDSKRLYKKTHTSTTISGGGLMGRYRAQVAQDLNGTNGFKAFGFQQAGGMGTPSSPPGAPATISMSVMRVYDDTFGRTRSEPQEDRNLPAELKTGFNPGGSHKCDKENCQYCDDGYKSCTNPNCEGGTLPCNHTTHCPLTVKGSCPGHTKPCPGGHTIACDVAQHYTSQTQFICTLEAHTHGESCRGLICGMTEHIHSEACYTLACSNEDPDHLHDDSCYTTNCGITVHSHDTALCYGNTCGKGEHIHSELCWGDVPVAISHANAGCGDGQPCDCDAAGCPGTVMDVCPGIETCTLVENMTCPTCRGSGVKTIQCPNGDPSQCSNRPDCPVCEDGKVACTNQDCVGGFLKACKCGNEGCKCYGEKLDCLHNMDSPDEYWTETGYVHIAYNDPKDVSWYHVKQDGLIVGKIGPSPNNRSLKVGPSVYDGSMSIDIEPADEPDDPDDGGPRHVSVNDGAGSRYRKIGLNGLPMADAKPQVQDESGERPEETYIDAYNLQLRHSVSDVYATAEGSLLPLMVRRDMGGEIWTRQSGLRPEEKPNLPFGPGWSSNVSSHIKYEYQIPLSGEEAPKKTAMVVDEQGGSQRYLEKLPGQWIHSGEEMLDAKTAKNVFINNVLFKKFGTTCFYEDAGISQSMPDNRVGESGAMIFINYSRLTEVRDREGNSLRYHYAGLGTLIPDLIYDPDRPGRSIQIVQSDGHIVQMRGPSGETISYHYSGLCLDSVTRGSTSVHYEYEQTWEKSENGNTDANHITNHLEVQGITDELGRSYIFHRTFDQSRQKIGEPFPTPGMPRLLTAVTTPGGTVQLRALWAGNHSVVSGSATQYAVSATRICRALDGTVSTYFFSNPYIYDARQANGLTTARANSITVTYTHMTVSRAKNGTTLGNEAYTYNPLASMALASARDLSGNTTHYTYGGNGYDDPLVETNALGQAKTYTYDPATRIMTSMTDALGTKTEYTLENKTISRGGLQIAVQGLKTAEVTTGVDGSRRETHYSYDHPVFAGLVTKQRTVSPNSGAMPSSVTTTTLGAATDGQVTNAGWWAEITQTTGTAGAGGGMGTVLSSTTTIHDLGGGKRSVIDGRGLMTNFDYDEHNRLTKVTHADLSHKDLAYDARGNLIRETNENGVTTFHQYDDLNRRIQSTVDLNGNGTPDLGYTTANSTPGTANDAPVYDGDLVTTTVYNNRDQVVAQTDPRGKVTTTTYDDLGRATLVNDGGLETMFVYGANSGGSVFDSSTCKPTQVTDPRGMVTTNTYDKLYRLISKSSTIGGTTTTTYDAAGNPLTVTDPLGRVTTNTYDSLGRLVTTSYPDGSEVHNLYTHHDKVWKTVDETGTETVTHYDAAGRAVEVITSVGGTQQAVTSTEYDGAGNVIKVTDPLGRETETEYDQRNRPVDVYAPTVWDGAVGQFVRPRTHTDYDALGLVVAVTDPMGAVSAKAYDRAGRLWKTTDALNHATVSRLDAGGNAITVTNAAGQTVTNTYDLHNRLTQSVDAAGIQNTFVYDAGGNKTAISDGLGQTTTFEYDLLNRLTRQTFANGDSFTYTYDALHKLSHTDVRGAVTTFEYDLRDNQTTTAFYAPGGTVPAWVRSMSYDAAKRLLSVTETNRPEATVAYTYDAQNRILSETSSGVTHQHEYDLAGNRVKTTYGTGRVVQTSYDGLNRPETLVEGGRVTRYGYDLAGRAVVLVAANGQVTNNTYDELGRVVDRTLFRTAAMTETDVVAEFGWAYDALGNVVAQHEVWPGAAGRSAQVRATTMTYDGANRLVTETIADPVAGNTATSYAYDMANNRTAKTVTGGSEAGSWTYTHNEANQLVSWTKRDVAGTTELKSATLTYDGNGNRASQTVTGTPDAGNDMQPPNAAIGITTYTWDLANRLMGVTLPNGNSYGYQYDYRGRRVSIVEGGSIGSPKYTAVSFSEGLSVAEWEAPVGGSFGPVATVEYQRGPDMGGGIGGLLYSRRGAAQAPDIRHNLFNARGDVVAQSNSAASVTWTASYEAFGRRTVETGDNDDKQRANTKDEDPTGLLNEGFRYRDLETGVFLSRDPAGFVDGPNVYTYVQQNPWTKNDPEGLFWHIAAAALIGAAISVASQAVCDVAAGKMSDLSTYAGAAAGGATTGAVLAATGNPTLAGAAGGAAQSATEQYASTGTVDGGQVMKDAAVGAAGGKMGAMASKALGCATNKVVKAVAGAAADAGTGAGTQVVDNVLNGRPAGEGVAEAAVGNLPGAGVVTAAMQRESCFLAGTSVTLGCGGLQMIETLRLGQRVSTPESVAAGQSASSETEVDPATWRSYQVRLHDARTGWDVFDIGLLRPQGWMAAHSRQIAGHSEVWVDFEELHASGWAEVIAEGPCASIASGPGRVVTATVTHANDDVRTLTLDGGETLYVTGNHRMFSASAQNWVAVKDLGVGEELQTASGRKSVAALGYQKGRHQVYNIEVEAEHCYFAGEGQTLTHNDCLRSAKTIKFSQDDIDSKFSDGKTLNETSAELRADPKRAAKIEPISLVKFNDLPPNVQGRLKEQGAQTSDVFSLNNRRLAAARAAKSQVNTRWATKDELKSTNLDRRFSTKTAGRGMPRRR